MNSGRVLVSWIGRTDLMEMATESRSTRQREILRILGSKELSPVRDGPIRTLLRHEKFAQVNLLNSYPRRLGAMFREWLPGRPRIHQFDLSSPISYAEVFVAADKVLSDVAPPGATESDDGTESPSPITSVRYWSIPPYVLSVDTPCVEATHNVY